MSITRDKISPGIIVDIVQKQDQSSGKLTQGIVKRILTSSNFHPHGIKVELESGKIGRVQNIIWVANYIEYLQISLTHVAYQGYVHYNN